MAKLLKVLVALKSWQSYQIVFHCEEWPDGAIFEGRESECT